MTKSVLRLLGRPWAVVAGAGLASLVYLLHMINRLPSQAIPTGDSAAYRTLESFRPPFYGWFLNAWQWLHGSLDGLPTLQLMLLMAALLLFAIEIGLMMRSAVIAIAVVPLIMAQPAIWEAPRWMMTEAIYVTQILAGMAMQFRHVRRGGGRSIGAAAFVFATSAILRSTGVVFLLLPLAAALLDRREPMRTGIRRAISALVVASFVILSAMGWNEARHGHFEIGSWAGISMLTKSLLLVQADDVEGMPPPIAAVAPYAEKNRELIAAQPDLAAHLRAQVQSASSDLRWGVFIPEADRSWPAWQEADWRMRGKLAGEVSSTLIRRHPLEALALWRNDWLALVVQPAYWPAGMTVMTSKQDEFIACGRDHNCWGLQRYDIPVFNQAVLLGVSLAGPVVALFVIVLQAGKVLRRRADAAATLFFLVALTIHANLLLTSAFEAGNARYTVAIHVLELPLLIWIGTLFCRWFVSRARDSGRSAYLTRADPLSRTESL